MEHNLIIRQTDKKDNLEKNIDHFLDWYYQFLLNNDIFLSNIDTAVKNMEDFIEKNGYMVRT